MHLFNRADIIEANRSGQQAVVVEVDLVRQEYVYQYLNPTSINFQGTHRHSFDDIENHWHKPKIQPTLLEEFEYMVSGECYHVWEKVLLFNQTHEYCSKCSKKRV